VYGSSASPIGYGGYFSHTAGGIPLYVDGDVVQSWTGDGLVKAGVVAQCNNSGAEIYRSFNNVAPFEEVSIANGAFAGVCTITFPFRVADRYWVAGTLPSLPGAGIVNCLTFTSPNDLLCYRYDTSGVGVGGAVLVLVY
jgi:hypothetical protein